MTLEGYDLEKLYRTWRRACVERQVRKIGREFNDAWRNFKVEKTLENYDKTVLRFLKGLSQHLDAQYGAKPSAKEIQAALWLSSESDFMFLAENSKPGSKNPDGIWQGRSWEMKRIESGNPDKLFVNAKRASLQSGNVILDLSLHTFRYEEALMRAGRIKDVLGLENLVLLRESEIRRF